MISSAQAACADKKPMKSDRNLLIVAAFALVIQLIGLAIEVDLLPLPQALQSLQSNSREKEMGRLTNVSNQVRTRSNLQLYWNDGELNTRIRSHDSLLTLEDSRARVEMDDQTILELAENTLIYFEPPQSKLQDEAIRIRFDKGSVHARVPGKSTRLFAGQTEVTFGANSEVKINSIANHQFELQVIQGAAKISRRDGAEIEVPPSVLIIDDKSTDLNKELKKFDQQVRFDPDQTKYRHYISLNQSTGAAKAKWTGNIHWKGAVTALQVRNSFGQIIETQVSQLGNSQTLELELGKYQMRLVSALGVSAWKEIEVKLSPQIQLVSPLPRDRVLSGQPVTFTWKGIQSIFKVKLEIQPAEGLRGPSSEANPVQWQSVGETTEGPTQTFLQSKVDVEGKYLWRVVAYDSEGFLITTSETNPIYFERRLLDAPDVKKPEMQKEMNDQDSGHKNERSGVFDLKFNLRFNWVLISQLLFSNAYAQSQSQKGSSEKALHFQWKKLDGADHYVLEVSRERNFRELILEVETSNPNHLWRGFPADLEKIYWRVAGGAKLAQGPSAQGKSSLGKFSLIQEAVLADLNVAEGRTAKKQQSKPVPEKQYQVEIKTVIPEATITKPATPQPVIQPPPSSASLLNDKPMEARPSETVNAAANDRQPITDAKYQLLVGADFSQEQSEDQLGSKVNFKGWRPSLNFKRVQKGSGYFQQTTVELKYSRSIWKSEDAWTSAQGDKMIQQEILAKWIGSHGSWDLILGLMQMDRPERRDLELLSMKTESGGILGIGGSWLWGGFESSTALEYWKSAQFDVKLLRWGGVFKTGKERRFLTGPQIQWRSNSGSDGSKGQDIRIGIQLGFEW